MDWLEKAWKLRNESQYDACRELLNFHLAGLTEDDFSTLGRAFHILMQSYYDQEDYENALRFNLKSISYYRLGSFPLKVSHALRHRADLYRALQNHYTADIYYKKALAYFKYNDKGSLDYCNALRAYAVNSQQLGRKQTAYMLWTWVSKGYQNLNIKEGVNEAKEALQSLAT